MQKLLMLLITAFFICLLMPHADAQIGIENEFMPQGGRILDQYLDEQFEAVIYNDVTLPSGGPHEFDLSDANFEHEAIGTVVDKSSAPLNSEFSSANLVVRYVPATGEADTIYSFSESTNSIFRDLGTVFTSSRAGIILRKYTSADPHYNFPINYGDQWIVERTLVEEYSADSYQEVKDSFSYDVDAWGSAKYNDNIFPCLRLSYTRKSVNSFYSQGMLISQTVNNSEGAEFIGEGFQFLAAVEKTTFGRSTTYTATASGEFADIVTGIRENQTSTLPENYELSQNYPNPFNPTTEIQFSLPKSSAVELAVYNMLGQKINTLVKQALDAGTYTVDWNGNNSAGNPVATGVYFYRLTVGEHSEARKMLLLK